MKHKLISIALIAVLLFMVLGNSIACTTPTTQYDLTITSTAGGDVTAPGEDTYPYAANATVNLVATPDSGYRFVNWTTTAGTFGSATAATTTFTMPAQDATVTAHFALGVLIEDVPDTSQPPTNNLPTTAPGTNYCAPMAMVNILGYWDEVMGLPNAKNVTAFLPNSLSTVAEYLGYFMDTNNNGYQLRGNGAHMGTFDKDIGPGTTDFVRWDAGHAPPPPPPPPIPLRPAGKLGYDWTVTKSCFIPTEYDSSLTFYEDEIDAGRPLVVSFSYWNPLSVGINVTDPATGELICVHSWGPNEGHSNYPDPEEYWDTDIGHAVTGVGYILNWDPDGDDTSEDYVIVYDNWLRTPKYIAIPWANWVCLFAVNPG